MPQEWQELVAARLLRGVPLDPAGVPFEIDAATGARTRRRPVAAVADAAGVHRDAATMNSVPLLVLAGVLGLAVGSFLNVCIYRLPLRQSLVHPPSRCPRCGRALSWFDNIPVLSWVALRGTLPAVRRADRAAVSDSSSS